MNGDPRKQETPAASSIPQAGQPVNVHLVDGPAPLILRCAHCGRRAPDVAIVWDWVGGHGYLPFAACADNVSCWARWGAANGLRRVQP